MFIVLELAGPSRMRGRTVRRGHVGGEGAVSSNVHPMHPACSVSRLVVPDLSFSAPKRACQRMVGPAGNAP